MEEEARALAEGIQANLQGWVERSVERVMLSQRGSVDAEVMDAARSAGKRAAADVGGRVRALLEQDLEDQRTNPLAILRQATAYPTEVLREAGVPLVQRDGFSKERFPDDIYDLTPASFSDIDPSLFDAGVAWGAAKAWEHKRRHRARRPA